MYLISVDPMDESILTKNWFLRIMTGTGRIQGNKHCLNKRERPLHSKRTSILHGWLLRFCQNIVNRFDRTSRFLIWLFFDNFRSIWLQNIWQLWRSGKTTHDAKQVEKKIKEKKMTADRNEKIKARKKVTETKKKNYTVLFDEKSF